MRVEWKDPGDQRRLADLVISTFDAKQRDRYGKKQMRNFIDDNSILFSWSSDRSVPATAAKENLKAITNSSIWRKELLRDMIAMLILATGKISVPDLCQFVGDLLLTREQVASPEWRTRLVIPAGKRFLVRQLTGDSADVVGDFDLLPDARLRQILKPACRPMVLSDVR